MNKDNYHEQGNIIITNLLLPLGHISNSQGGRRASGDQQAVERLAFPFEGEEADSRPVVPLFLGGRLGRALW